jgi:hypothetical protein
VVAARSAFNIFRIYFISFYTEENPWGYAHIKCMDFLRGDGAFGEMHDLRMNIMQRNIEYKPSKQKWIIILFYCKKHPL